VAGCLGVPVEKVLTKLGAEHLAFDVEARRRSATILY